MDGPGILVVIRVWRCSPWRHILPYKDAGLGFSLDASTGCDFHRGWHRQRNWAVFRVPGLIRVSRFYALGAITDATQGRRVSSLSGVLAAA